ncbi:MAG: glutathione peroxidase, partial [Bacteroidota bacterium]
MINLLFVILTTLATPPASIYDFKVEAIDGTTIDFSQFKGKKLLIVNTASKCGYTPQYEDLQELHELHGDKLTILGFPSNNFMGQEPGTNLEIAEFCKANYGVTFQLFSKIDVKGKNQHPLYSWLSDKDKNGWNDKAPTWNFCKYLINENGQLVHFYKSGVKPLDQKIIAFING